MRSGAQGRFLGTPRRVAMVSVHTSPLDQPGTGDAGGLNVYLVELAVRLAGLGIEVEVFTRATSGNQPATVELAPRVLLHHVIAGPFGGMAKADLPAHLCTFARGLLRAEAGRCPGWYDLVHSHYWLSGQVGAMVAMRWGVPLVHTMHTMAKVKNARLADGDRPEPAERVDGEEQLVAAADRLLANTAEEAEQLRSLYDAPADRVEVVHPGVDLAAFAPGDRGAARRALGIDPAATVLAFAGRIQPLKAPDLLLRAVAVMVRADPGLRDRLLVPVIGGVSGDPIDLAGLAGRLGIADLVRFVPPQTRAGLADWFRAATAVVVPSYNESFGLVAMEAQATGTPVVAAATGGLPTAVRDGHSGVLVDGHDPQEWARVLADLIADPDRLAALGVGAREQAARFDWSATAAGMLGAYGEALSRPPRAGGRLRAAS